MNEGMICCLLNILVSKVFMNIYIWVNNLKIIRLLYLGMKNFESDLVFF